MRGIGQSNGAGLKLALVTWLARCGFLIGCNSPPEPPPNTTNPDTAANCSFDVTALKGLCPAGTAYESSYDSQASSACQANVTTTDSVVSVCIPTADQSCRVSCKVIKLCDCGMDYSNAAGVVCRACNVCGNGVTEPPKEQCDQGSGNGTGAGCDNNCQITTTACTLGDLRCSQDNMSVQVCKDGVWSDKTVCTSDQVCNSTTNQCVTVPAYCDTPGATRCVGSFGKQQCGADRRWAADSCPNTTPICKEDASGMAVCVMGSTASTSANFRLDHSQLVSGGIYGFSASTNYRVQFGPLKQ